MAEPEVLDHAGVTSNWGPAALESGRRASTDYQNRFAGMRQKWVNKNAYYYDSVKRLLQFIVEPNRRVLGIHCENGLWLDAVRPSRGVGVEVGEKMVEMARQSYPQYQFLTAYPEELDLNETFDYIIFNRISDTTDILAAFQRLKPLCQSHSRLVIYTYNHLWKPIIELAEKMGFKMPLPEPNWLLESDLRSLLLLSGFEWLYTYKIILFPKWIPFISEFFNRFVARLPGFKHLCMVRVLVARPAPIARALKDISVSIIIPCKNEVGNIESAAQRIPGLGKHTEIIFCNDQSTDGTADKIKQIQQEYPEQDIKLVEGPGLCKAKNVWAGFNAAKGDVLMILDADLAVMPEELPYFFKAIVSGTAEFVNGSRCIYPMQKRAMKFMNMLGNKFFSIIFSYLLNQSVKDTLCGTKVLWRSDWERMKPRLDSWGTSDRWGDYELLFGAAKLHLRIVDLPVHYQERIHGATKMVKVFRNGLIMLRMCWAGFLKLKWSF